MKYFTLTLIALLMAAGLPLRAQHQDQAKEESVVIIKEYTDEDGQAITIKKRLSGGAAASDLIESFSQDGSVEYEDAPSNNLEIFENGNGETIFMFRRSGSPSNDNETEESVRSFQIVIPEEGYDESDYDYDYKQDWDWKEKSDWSGDKGRLFKKEGIKAFLGVYPSSSAEGEGVKINGVVDGTGAEAAGLQEGDRILELGGYPTKGRYGLRGALSQLSPGQEVLAIVERGGQRLELPVVLGEKSHNRYVFQSERDPCQVFIGVYVGGRADSGQGVQVTNIIERTPAEEAGLLPGDVILSMDGVAVNDNGELLTERDKHEPGDAFTLEVERAGGVQQVDARFLACEAEQPSQVEEELPLDSRSALPETEEEGIDDAAPDDGGRLLQLKNYKAFPVPSYGDVQVQFEAEAKPTTVQLIDAAGKVIYTEQLNNFDGEYNKELNLREAASGNIILSIRQGDKAVAKPLLLLNRA